MEVIGATEARANFADILRRVSSGGERIAIERRGKEVAVIVPIGDQQQADAQAGATPREGPRDANTLFNETERLAGLGHWEWDEVADRCIYCSEELARIHGLTVQEFIAQASSLAADLKWVHPDDRDRYLRAIGWLREYRRGFEIEYRLRRADGNYLEVREKGEPVFDEQGFLVRSFGFVQDITDRKKSERANQQNEALLKQAMRTARMGAWVWDDVEDECLYCSEELALLFGQSVEEYMATRGKGSGASALIHPDDRAHYRQYIEAAKAADRWHSVEFRELVADGTYRHFREVGEPISDANDKRQISIGIRQDTTELKEAEQALRLSEAALNHAQRQARIGNWRWDVKGRRLIFCSEECTRIHGVTIHDAPALTGAQLERLIHPDDRERVGAVRKRFTDSGSNFEIEYRIVRPDGEVRQVLEFGEFILDGHGRAVELAGTVQDITERKRAEEELKRYRDELELRVEEQTAQLRASEQRLKEAQRIASLGSWELTAAGELYWSDEVFRIFDVDPEDFDRATAIFYDRVHPDDRDYVSEVTARAWDSKEPYYCVHRIIRRDGEVRTVRERAETVCDALGTRLLMRGTVQDITEYTEVEKRLNQAMKMEAVGQLTGGVAHDFNNLLSVIMGNTELLEDRLGPEDKLLGAIMRASKRGAELTQRLLAFSRRQPLRPVVIDLGALVSDMSEMLTRTLGATIDIGITAAPDLWAALADSGQVENALLNLAINARDAMPDGGRLTIESANASFDEKYAAKNPDVLAGDYVLLAVTDTGSGMTEEVKAHAFEPFFTTKGVGEGSGLGLSMVYGFAKQSGGHVSIYSEDGRGTTIKLYLPRVDAAPLTGEARAHASLPRGRGQTVLVVEDDADLRVLTVEMLEGLGYRVIVVPEAAAARAVLADGKPVDLLLSDVVLPGGISGPELAETVGKSHPGLPVIFISGYSAEAAKRGGFLGSDKVLLSKPFSRHQLARALHQALG